MGLRLLSPPYRMEGEAIERDMAELVPSPVVLTAAIVGFGKDDRVLELIEYPAAHVPAPDIGRPCVTRSGITHIGLLCDDIDTTRADLEDKGVTFLTSGIADVAGLRTTWCHDPWGTVIAQAGPDGDGVIVAELDLAGQRATRRTLPALEHRRPDAYTTFAAYEGAS